MTAQILVVVGIFAVVAGIAWLGHRQRQQRIAELEQVAIRRAFNAEAIALFSQNAGWSVQASNGSVAVFLTDRRCKPQELPAFLADALRIQDSFTRASSG